MKRVLDYYKWKFTQVLIKNGYKVSRAYFSKDGKYYTLVDGDEVIVIDCSNHDLKKPLIFAEIPNVNGAIYENGELYVSIDDSNKIYLWKNNSLEVFRELDQSTEVNLPISTSDIVNVELMFQVKGSDKWVVKVNKYYSVYDPQKNAVMYWLYDTEKLKDYVICDENGIGILLGTSLFDRASYSDIDRVWYKMSIFDLSICRSIDSLAYVEIMDDWSGKESIYPLESEYKWPLIKYTYAIPDLIVCTENPRYVLCLVLKVYFVVDILTGELLRIIDSELLPNDFVAVFIDKKLTRLVIALDDKIQTYEINEIPQKELNELNQIYMLLAEEINDEEEHEKYFEYHERFSKIKIEYSDIKLISEKDITTE